MNQLTVQLETLTPTFMSGNPQGAFELRPPSLKGMLRFWWRAYYWGSGTTDIPPDELERQEGTIFGTATGDGRKSPFSLRVQDVQREKAIKSFPEAYDPLLFKYLAYGPKCPPHHVRFNLVLNFADIAIERDVILTIYFWTLFGAMGAKSRNGFGNVRVINAEEVFDKYALPYPSISTDLLTSVIRNDTVPNFSAFSRKMKLFKLAECFNTDETCHAELGQVYKNSKRRLDERFSCKKRKYIAAPIKVKKIRGPVLDKSDERLAKPYFLRVLPEGDAYRGYILYLPSRICRKKDNDDTEADTYRHEFNARLTAHGMEEVPLWESH